MKIKPKTPRTEMAHQCLINKMATFYEALGEEMGYGKEAVDTELSHFSALSARVEFNGKGEIDFDLALPTDTPEQIRVKFLRYCETQHYRKVEDALQKIAQLDMPLVPEHEAPALAKDAPKN